MPQEGQFLCRWCGGRWRTTGIPLHGNPAPALFRAPIGLSDDSHIVVDRTRRLSFDRGEWDRSDAFLRD